MDYNNMDSEVIESLNLLRPPVKRKPCDAYRDCIVNSNTDNIVVQDFSIRKVTTVTDKRSLGDSASLILKKTSEDQILKQYSTVHYTRLYNKSASQKNKPLIKVTVIPKQGLLGSKVLGKPKVVTKAVQSTASNHENSVKTKHLYLVVAGRTRNKIYEIKTTGSAKFDTKQIKDGAIEFGTINNLVNTLSMEKKRKKNKGSSDEQNEAQSISESIQCNEHICTCEPSQKQEPNNLQSGKSRVKVYGKIGLTQNDKYIVRCQATVNDKPVPIISTVEKQSSSSSCIPEYHNNTTSTYQFGCMGRETQNTDSNYHRDFKLQTDFQNNAVQEIQVDVDNEYKISKESQSTQVNFNYKSNENNRVDCDSSYYNTKHRVSKCYCTYPAANTVLSSHTEKSTEFKRNNDVKSRQTPLVIISVFPKQDDNLTDIIKTCATSCVEQMQTKRDHESDDRKKITISHQNENENQNEFQYQFENINENEEKEPKPVKHAIKKERNGSPQPKGRKQKLVNESKHAKPSLKTDSSLPSGQKNSKGALQFFNSNTKKESKKKTRKQSPVRSPRPKSPTAIPKPQKTDISRQNLSPRPKSPKKVDIGVNTEHLQEKKAIVESYTKKLDEQMSPGPGVTYKGKPPANSFSKVSVNIDSGNEYYDVHFRQDYRTTDVNVRKTMKDAGAQNNLDATQIHGSLENYFPYMSKKHGKNIDYSCQYVDDQSNDAISIVSDTTRLTPRDSLEISHRREDKNLKIMQASRPSTNEKLTENSDDLEFLASKHYSGDDCDIGDPIERDREIRLLLGVEDWRHKSKTRYVEDLQCQDFEIGNLSLQRCYAKQCETPITIPTNYTMLNSTNFSQIHYNITKSKPAMYSETHEHAEKRIGMDPIDPQTKKNDNPFKTYSIINTKSNKIVKRRDKGTQLHQLSSQKVNPAKTNSTILKLKMNNTYKCQEQIKHNKETKSCHQQTNQNDNQFETNSTILESKNITNKCNEQTKHNKKTKSFFQQTSQNDILNIKLTGSEVKQKNQRNRRRGYRQTNPELITQRQEELPSIITEDYETKTVQNETNIEEKNIYQQFTLNRNIQVLLQVEQSLKQKPIVLSRKQYSKVRKTIQNMVVSSKNNKKYIKKRSIVSIGHVRDMLKKNVLANCNKQVQSESIKVEIKRLLGADLSKNHDTFKKTNEKEIIILYSRNVPRGIEVMPLNDSTKEAVSSVQIVSNVSREYLKDVTFSSMNVGSIGSSSYGHRSEPIVETLFKRHRRSVTPNLGTSALSLLSTEANKTDSRVKLSSPDVKAKKPFLKRLMSCLVMRSSATANADKPSIPTITDSSVDSYHISTTFGAIEMTSSIYDTTASFYSNHSIHPLSSKLKRGFFSSVIGLLTNRKS